MFRYLQARTTCAAVLVSVACCALLLGAGSAQARLTTPRAVSPAGFHVTESAAATGGGRTAVLISGYRSTRDFSLLARLGDARGLGPVQRLVAGSGELPQVAVGADGTAVAAWTSQRRGSTPSLRVAVARPGHSFGRSQTLSHARSMALGGVAVTATGRAVVTWRKGTSAVPVQAAVAAPGHAFGAAQTIGDSEQSLPSIAVAPSGTVVVTWLDTPDSPKPPPAPPPAQKTARVLAATLTADAASFGSATQLAELGFWFSAPEAADGPGGAAVTWRQAVAEVRLASLTTQNAFAPAVALPPYKHGRDGDADLVDHVALGLPSGGENVALWREVRTRNLRVTYAAVKSSYRPAGGAFSPATRLSTGGWLAGTPRADAMTDRTVAAWGESGPGRSRVRIAVRRVGHGWTALAPLSARGLGTERVSASASPRDAVVTWVQDVNSLGAGRLYLVTYRP